MNNFLSFIVSLLWDHFLVYLILGVSLYLTFKLRFMQIKYLPYALKLAFTRSDQNAQGDISQFQSLMTSLAATIGIGSIAGMATAVMAGGMGSLFWMWLMAFLGMATKYSEAILAVMFREKDHKNEMCGGPMYYIEKGLKNKRLAKLFAFFGICSALAGGNLIQSHSITHSMEHLMHVPPYVTAVLLLVLTTLVIIGGIKSLGKINAFLVPLMALFYLLAGIIILVIHREQIPLCFSQIFSTAFSGQAAFGGFIGASTMQAVKLGIARGISSNEAGLGSSPIASAAAKTDVPGRQALISMTGVFLSSFIVCTITVLVIGVTQVMGGYNAKGELLNGAPLVIQAFSSTIPFGEWIVGIGLVLFGFSTILGWSYYGEKCTEYLLGEKKLIAFRYSFLFVVFMGCFLSLEVVWSLADIMNGLMAFSNLVGIFFLVPVIVKESNRFFILIRKEKAVV